jgi:hypothetical protein
MQTVYNVYRSREAIIFFIFLNYHFFIFRENEIDPVLQTYQILMSLFAEKGDMQSMKWV